MLARGEQELISNKRDWLLLAAGGLAAFLSTGWAIRRMRRNAETAVETHAGVVPIDQAKVEAHWTRQANVHSSESKG